jgi:hypothetical protein
MLEGFTTVIVAFFIFCLYRQDLIKHRTYYYATFVVLMAIILFNVFYYFMENTYGRGFCAVMLGLLHAGAMVLTMSYVGGVSPKQIGAEVAKAVDDVRQGPDAKKPVIVPFSGEKPKPKDAYVEEEREQAEKPRIVIELPKKPGDDKGALPID